MSSLEWVSEDIQLRANLQSSGAEWAVTIGNFDGLHLGHQRIFTRLRSWAQSAPNRRVGVMTFNPHPDQYFSKSKKHDPLYSLEQQKSLYQQLGVNCVFVKKFDQDFAGQTKEQFLEYFFDLWRPQYICVGYDFAFAQKRSGHFVDLQRHAVANNVQAEQIEALQREDATISTTYIRQCLSDADMEAVTAMLGRDFSVVGVVVSGAKRGRVLGFPTANLQVSGVSLPKSGVYAGYVIINGVRHIAVANLGTNPTFHEQGSLAPVKFEVHILDFNGDLYDSELSFYFSSYLRGEMKFGSVEQLREQIAADIVLARGKVCL